MHINAFSRLDPVNDLPLSSHLFSLSLRSNSHTTRCTAERKRRRKTPPTERDFSLAFLDELSPEAELSTFLFAASVNDRSASVLPSFTRTSLLLLFQCSSSGARVEFSAARVRRGQRLCEELHSAHLQLPLRQLRRSVQARVETAEQSNRSIDHRLQRTKRRRTTEPTDDQCDRCGAKSQESTVLASTHVPTNMHHIRRQRKIQPGAQPVSCDGRVSFSSYAVCSKVSIGAECWSYQCRYLMETIVNRPERSSRRSVD